jgi:phosphoribosylanthranilate isomerase
MSAPTRVKICGITRLEDAELSVELGAWALGMIFYDSSPRCCSMAQARRISAAVSRRVQLCGVFVNAPLDEVAQIADELNLDMVQLHGDEGPAYCAETARRTRAQVIKAIQVAGPGDVRELVRYHVDYHLADASATSVGRALRGGTGDTFDWALLDQRRSPVPLILSGGLQAENVVAAIAATNPFAVDTASGTEFAPGQKDPERLRCFFEAVASTVADIAEGTAVAP